MIDLTQKPFEFREYRKTTTTKAVQIPIPFHVKTLEGTMVGEPGDWLAEGVDGERYPIANSIFLKTYEEVDDE